MRRLTSSPFSRNLILRALLLSLACLSPLASLVAAPSGKLKFKDGYFWDPAQNKYILPRGVAYQTWNPEVGANQTFEQIEYDLTEFKKLFANSVRCEFVWSQIEPGDDLYDFEKFDRLVALAERLDLKLFVLIGFQYPPKWFPKELYGTNDRGERSDVLNYEHPEARRLYQEHISRVVAHFKNSPAIGGWILGNEYAYFDLWEDPALYPIRRFLGYDPISIQSFKAFITQLYQNNISHLNANWETTYPNFDAIVMPASYPADRHAPAYHDLIQWRKKSIGDFVAAGAIAARQADPDRLVTYSMVGGIYSGTDANNTTEDAKAIVDRCALAGAPLDFWSINNYAWASFGSEMRSADYGVAKYQDVTALPVMISETGHSSTETFLGEGAAERQPKALPSQLWESVMSGAVGVHFFHWNDRNQFSGSFLREKGFGIVQENRRPKRPVFDHVAAFFRRMENIQIDRLIGGSRNPPADIQFFWSINSDMGWPRANQENAMIWGALKRLGYQPRLIDDHQFDQGQFTNAPVLLLSRAYQLSPDHLDALSQRVLAAGVHLHANADLPGQFNEYHKPNANWTAQMRRIFGLETASAFPARDDGSTNSPTQYHPLTLKALQPLALFPDNASISLVTWKIWHNLRASSGSTILTHTGLNGSQAPLPAVHLHSVGPAKSAINTFALGDTHGGNSRTQIWDTRYAILHAIYREHFGLIPSIDLTGPGAEYISSDYRLCSNGSILISLLNEHTNRASVTLRAPRLLDGMTIENLSSGGLSKRNPDGTLSLELLDDDFILLYAYPPAGEAHASLVNPSPQKLWFTKSPLTVWPAANPVPVEVAFDIPSSDYDLFVAFESARPPHTQFSRSPAIPVNAQGQRQLQIVIPDLDGFSQSSREGGQYQFRAVLQKNGVQISSASIPTRLTWLARHLNVPAQLLPGRSYSLPLKWEDLPSLHPDSDQTPLQRTLLWDSLAAEREQFEITLELLSDDLPVASDRHLTSRAHSQHPFQIQVPSAATGPFTWRAFVRSAPTAATIDFTDGFEGRERGAETQRPNLPPLISPWKSYVNSEIPNRALWQDEGVHLGGNGGGQAAFLVVTNLVDSGRFAIFGIEYFFPQPWSLPSDPALWKNYQFRCDFHDQNRLPAVVELQVKNKTDAQNGLHLLHFQRDYLPGKNGWFTLSATLDQFVKPSFSGPFDPAQIHSIVINVQMLKSGQYISSIDNIHFDGPDQATSVGPVLSYDSQSSQALPDSDRDGIPDAHESNTGIFTNPSNTGTHPQKPDSDSDGASDGSELVAGTNPNHPGDFLAFSSVHRNPLGQIVLSWLAQPGRSYSVSYSHSSSFSERLLLPLQPPTSPPSLTQPTPVEVIDLSNDGSSSRFYQLTVFAP